MRKKLRGFSVQMKDTPLCNDTIEPKTNILGIFVDSPVTHTVIKKLPALKLIVTMSTGYDHIAVTTAKRKNIPVCNVPNYGGHTVAEHTLALMLALSRKLFPSIKRVKEGVYDYHGLRGYDIQGKTIGIIGTGRIGMQLVRMLQGFDATVIAYDPCPDTPAQTLYNFQYATFERLIRTADILSLHVPLLPETTHLINKTVLKKMKHGAYIINTARGGLIDAEALVKALDDGTIAGAGLDVLEDEGLVEHHEELFGTQHEPRRMRLNLMNNILIDHPHTIITPHNAFNSTEAITRIMDTTIENITSYVHGNIQNDVTNI